MDEQRRSYRGERLPLSPGISNSLDKEDELMAIGPLLFVLGIGAVILLIVVVALL